MGDPYCPCTFNEVHQALIIEKAMRELWLKSENDNFGSVEEVAVVLDALRDATELLSYILNGAHEWMLKHSDAITHTDGREEAQARMRRVGAHLDIAASCSSMASGALTRAGIHLRDLTGGGSGGD